MGELGLPGIGKEKAQSKPTSRGAGSRGEKANSDLRLVPQGEPVNKWPRHTYVLKGLTGVK